MVDLIVPCLVLKAMMITTRGAAAPSSPCLRRAGPPPDTRAWWLVRCCALWCVVLLGKPAIKPSDQIQAFLRVRPLTEAESVENGSVSFLEIDEATNEITTVPPVTNDTTQKVRNGAPHKHTFTKVFAEKTDQQELFEETALPMVSEVFKGNNSLLFTYGVTNAGKTYTVQGNAEEPGIVPRSLDVIFNSIGEHLVGEPTVRPYCFDMTKPVTAEDKLGLEQLRSDCQAAHRKIAEPTAEASQSHLDLDHAPHTIFNMLNILT